MFCANCGAHNEEEAVFCGECGAVLHLDELPDDVAEATKADVEEGLLVDEPLDEPVVERVLLDSEDKDEWPEASSPIDHPSSPPMPSRTVSAPTSGLAVASLLLGIGGLTILPLLGSVLAVLLGYMARKDIRQRPGQVSGDGLAVAGIVMGWVVIGATALIAVLALLGVVVGICGFGLCGIAGSATG